MPNFLHITKHKYMHPIVCVALIQKETNEEVNNIFDKKEIYVVIYFCPLELFLHVSFSIAFKYCKLNFLYFFFSVRYLAVL